MYVQFNGKAGKLTNVAPRVRKQPMTGSKNYLDRISKNFIRGEQIMNIDEVIKLAKEKKSVYSTYLGIRNASMFVNWSCVMIDSQIKAGRLFKTIKIN